MKQTIIFAAVILSLTSFFGCAQQTGEESAQAETAAPAAAPAMPGSHTGTVLETMDAGTYTYVRVDVGGEEIWAAGPATAIEVGSEVTVPVGMAMENFHSDTLDRDFPLIYFVEALLPASAAPAGQQMPEGHPVVQTGSSDVSFEGIAVADGGVTVAELYARKADLGGTQVSLRGRVVKVNLGIMGKNWLHVQDGTGDTADGSNDITVTTDAVAQVGDTVLVSGTLTVDKDFGAGYRYNAIVEEATVTVE